LSLRTTAHWFCGLFLLFGSVVVHGEGSDPLVLEENGWTIRCAVAGGSLSIESKDLGSVVRNIELQAEGPSGVHRLTFSHASITQDQTLVIEAAEFPAGSKTAAKSTWTFAAQPGKVVIATSDFHGLLTGLAAVGSERTVSALQDREGLPVNWRGTSEALDTYHGAITSKPSFLPREHPEVMQTALGQVSGRGLHALFDRKTDTAIEFGEGAMLEPVSADAKALRLTLPVRDTAILAITPNYFTTTLGVPFYVPLDDSHFPTAPIVWSSWTSYYAAVTEQDMVRNTDWMAEHLKRYGLEYVVLDDGYDRRPEGHAWTTNWNTTTFPHGAEWLTHYIHSKGFKAGLWLVPNATTVALKEHPNWYLYDKQGKVLRDYDTPALDSTNPHTAEHLKSLFTTLDGMGFDYYKFDGESALPLYAPGVDKSRLHSPSIDFVENFRERMRVIRGTIGPNRFIEECPAGTPLNAIGYVDSYFNGEDVYNNWQGMHALFSSITNNLFLNHMVMYVMPGEGLELGEPMTLEQAASRRPAITLKEERGREDPATGFGTTIEEARTLVTWVALTGVVYPLASVMPELPPARLQLLQATMPTLPITPVDLYSRGSDSSWDKFKHVQAESYIHHYPEVLDLKINQAAGVYDVVADTNWRNEATERHLDFNALGLTADAKLVAFDFWKQQPVGVYSSGMDLEIGPHDTRVLLLHPLKDHPQLIGNSRHISGSYSIVKQEWDATQKVFRGTSTTLDQEPYKLWFRVPAGYNQSAVEVLDRNGKSVKATWQQQGEFASLSFVGSGDTAQWQIRF
jgi:Melibiase